RALRYGSCCVAERSRKRPRSVEASRVMTGAGQEQGTPRSPPQTRGGGARRPPSMPRNAWLWFALILVLNFVVFRMLFPPAGAGSTIPYTVFKEQVVAGNGAAIYNQGQGIEGRFHEPVTYPAARAAADATRATESGARGSREGADDGGAADGAREAR